MKVSAKPAGLLPAFVFWKVLIIVTSVLAIFLLPLTQEFTPSRYYRGDMPSLFWVWGNFDGLHYMTIAHEGYVNFIHGFFPLYPWIIRMVSGVTGIGELYSGLIVSHLALLTALMIVIRLLRTDSQESMIRDVLLVFFMYPASVFYGAVYNDSLFFMFACAVLLLGRQRRWLSAGIVGALATLTRMNGLALFVFLCAEYVAGNESIQQQWNVKHLVSGLKNVHAGSFLKEKAWGMFFVPTGLGMFLLYTQRVYGNWHLVFTDMSLWQRDKFTFPLQVFWRYIKIFITISPTTIEFWRAVWELGFVFLFVFLVIVSFRKIRLSYWIFFVLSLLIPMTTGTFQGMPRYGLHLYPMFLALALWLPRTHTAVRLLYISVSIFLLLVFTVLFTRGVFVA